jgi:hypothetical protein
MLLTSRLEKDAVTKRTLDRWRREKRQTKHPPPHNSYGNVNNLYTSEKNSLQTIW